MMRTRCFFQIKYPALRPSLFEEMEKLHNNKKIILLNSKIHKTFSCMPTNPLPISLSPLFNMKQVGEFIFKYTLIIH
jgi:hypothetical protein